MGMIVGTRVEPCRRTGERREGERTTTGGGEREPPASWSEYKGEPVRWVRAGCMRGDGDSDSGEGEWRVTTVLPDRPVGMRVM